ncbi:MAG: STAS domain-containing protein [Armatimonadetes bacterium]|jgi:anti-sigma B factor antagonist|nr:STAS domain-containing protein [Armatimonadota bacterium]
MEMDLVIGVRHNGAIPIIDLSGEVDAYTSARFREAMIELIEGGSASLIISLLKVDYIDSSGLGALVGGLKRSTENGGRIVLLCNNPQIRKVFEITGLEKVFPIYEDEADALSILS